MTAESELMASMAKRLGSLEKELQVRQQTINRLHSENEGLKAKVRRQGSQGRAGQGGGNFVIGLASKMAVEIGQRFNQSAETARDPRLRGG